MQDAATIDLSGIGQGLLPFVAAIITIVIAYALISSVFQFVFFDAIQNDNIAIRRYFRREILNGLRYFGFIFCISAIFFSLLALPLALILSASPIVELGTLAQRAILFFCYIAYAMVLGSSFLVMVMFTTDFVVPVMRVDNCGILSGWRRCIRLFRGRWRQAAVYAGMKIIFLLVMGMIVGILVAVTAIIAGLPVFLIIAGQEYPPIGISAHAVLFAAYICFVTFSGLLYSVPFVTFLRCYSLYVLGGLNGAYDVFAGSASVIPQPVKTTTM